MHGNHNYSLLISHYSLNVKATETHHCHSHETHGDKHDAEALQGLGNVGVLHLLADGTHSHDGQRPTDTRAEAVDHSIPNRGDGLRVGGLHEDALLHEQRGTHDGAVDGDQRQEDTQGSIERDDGREILDKKDTSNSLNYMSAVGMLMSAVAITVSLTIRKWANNASFAQVQF